MEIVLLLWIDFRISKSICGRKVFLVGKSWDNPLTSENIDDFCILLFKDAQMSSVMHSWEYLLHD